ncbi:GntR family transcriptional regulator, partial [Leuconostoc pseudomesenteroides]|uniref:GntR family transcriptional regulator n=1 Tax=Leuconostoc pseudomesenteroides TaxID=33968 RepID=UPI0039E90B76
MNDDLSWVPSELPLQPPLYQSLYQSIQNDIENGILPPYKQLPSQRELSYFLDIHFTTVTHAYELAIKQGLLYSEKGRGTFVSPNGVRDNTIQAQNNASHISDLGILNMGSTPNSLAEKTIK